MFDQWLESSHRDDSNTLSNIRFGEEITQAVLIEIYFRHLIKSYSDYNKVMYEPINRTYLGLSGQVVGVLNSQ